MIFLSYSIGLALPTLIGFLLITICERKKRLLYGLERIVMSCIVGLTFSMLMVFLAHTLIGIPLSLLGFCGTLIAIALVLGGLYFWMNHNTSAPPVLHEAGTMKKWQLWLIVGLGALIGVRTLLMATTFLFLTPTYLDDTLDNWNLRGKVFFYDQELTLVMPGEDPEISPQGVSSYAPAVPLMKTWFAVLAGEWSEPVANGIHIMWYVGGIIILYYALRRRTTIFWSAIGCLMLASLPLYAMHGANPYADAFLSVHVLLAVSFLYSFLSSTIRAERQTYIVLCALATGLLAGFTKNEGLLVYTPPILLILVVGLVVTHRKLTREAIQNLMAFAIPLILLILPWLTFKWMNGLTFGNAKAVSSLELGWQPGVLSAVAINTFFEANWHLLFPLLILLLIWRWKVAFRSRLVILTSFSLIVYMGQLFLFMFTALSAEALRQTGYARGLVQLAPVLVLLTALLLADSFNALAQNKEIEGDDL